MIVIATKADTANKESLVNITFTKIPWKPNCLNHNQSVKADLPMESKNNKATNIAARTIHFSLPESLEDKASVSKSKGGKGALAIFVLSYSGTVSFIR